MSHMLHAHERQDVENQNTTAKMVQTTSFLWVCVMQQFNEAPTVSTNGPHLLTYSIKYTKIKKSISYD